VRAAIVRKELVDAVMQAARERRSTQLGVVPIVYALDVNTPSTTPELSMFKLRMSLVPFGMATLVACGTEIARERAAAMSDRPVATTDRPPATTDRPAAASERPATVSAVAAPGLDPQQVPDDLRHLLPIAERWGIGDDVERNAKVDGATPEERDELRTALRPHRERITEWLNSFHGQLSDEAGAFMYMQLAVEEMIVGNPR
jgi:hypothetical protein